MNAFEDAFNHTSAEWAPWYIIPADNKWFTRTVVADVITEKLKSLKLGYPAVSDVHRQHLVEAKELLDRNRPMKESEHAMNDTTVQVDRMVSILYGASVKKRIKRRDGVVRVVNFLSDTATFVYDEGPDDIRGSSRNSATTVGANCLVATPPRRHDENERD